jgi:hypothetical protein
MRRRRFLEAAGCALTVAATNRVFSGAVSASAESEKLILELERRWMDAAVQRDETTLKSLTADAFTRVDKTWPNVGMPKSQWIANTVRFDHVESFKYLNITGSVSGRTARVSIEYRQKGVSDQRPFNEIVTAEDTWEERDGRWQIVKRFVTSTTKAAGSADSTARRKEIKVDSAIYAAYVGQYRFGPGRVLTISQDGSRLIHQGSGGQRAELFPETTTQFFRKDTNVLTTFAKDKDGRVTHLVHRHSNGRESTGIRIA